MDWTKLSEQWLRELSDLLEIEPLLFDEQGVCGLAFDDRWYITLIDDAESECWRIYGSWWDETDQELNAKTVRDLFAIQAELMFDEGVCFSYDSHGKQWLLCHSFSPQDERDIQALEQILAQQLRLMQWSADWLEKYLEENG